MKAQQAKIRIVKNLVSENEEYQTEPAISVTVPKSIHQKLTQLGWILHTDKKPKLNVITYNIIDKFIVDYREEIVELQKSKDNIF